jgi:hypothetical protein
MIPKEFFTVQSMLTLTGAAGMTLVISNGIQQAFSKNPRWLALIIAQILSIMGTYISHKPDADWTDYFVAVVNGFLIFVTAAGGTHIGGGGGAQGQPRGPQNLTKRGKRAFFTPWF